MDYAMKDYFKRKSEEEKLLQAETEVVQPAKKSWLRKNLFSWEFSLSVESYLIIYYQMLLFAIIAGAFYYINGWTSILSRAFGKS